MAYYYSAEHRILVYRRFCLDIWVSAVCSREFTLIGILKKFIKGFDLLLFGGTQHIDVSAIFVWIFESRESVLESLVNRHFDEVYKRVWFVIIWWNTALWFIGDFYLDIWVSAVCSRKFSLIGILKKFLKGFDLLLFVGTQHIG